MYYIAHSWCQATFHSRRCSRTLRWRCSGMAPYGGRSLGGSLNSEWVPAGSLSSEWVPDDSAGCERVFNGLFSCEMGFDDEFGCEIGFGVKISYEREFHAKISCELNHGDYINCKKVQILILSLHCLALQNLFHHTFDA